MNTRHDHARTVIWVRRLAAITSLTIVLIVGLPFVSYSQSDGPDATPTNPTSLSETLGVSLELISDMLNAGIPIDEINSDTIMRYQHDVPSSLELSESELSQFGQPDVPMAELGIEGVQGIVLDSCNSQYFPFVYLGIKIDIDGSPVPGLSEADISCSEDNVPQTDYFKVTPPQQGGGVRSADIVFLIDVSGSMSAEIAGVRDNVSAFAQALLVSDIDFRLGLVRFGNGSGANPFIFNGGNLTDDVELLRQWISSLSASGGYEPGFLAVRQAIEGMNFRPGSQKVFVLISDEDSDDRSKQQTIDLLIANDVTVHTAVNCSNGFSTGDYCDETSIRGMTGGLLFSVVGPYDQVLDSIASTTADTYLVRYRAANAEINGFERNVVCTISAPVIQGTASCSYTPGAAPSIRLSPATLQLNGTTLSEGTSPTIEAEVLDIVPPLVQATTLYYRRSGSGASYSSVTMATTDGQMYTATIPAVLSPGVDYYVSATDGVLKTSLPSTDPGITPFQIAVLPNVAPNLHQIDVRFDSTAEKLLVAVNASDETNNLVGVNLQWRPLGELLYRGVPMTAIGAGRYVGEIPKNELTSEIQFYVQAADDLGVASTLASADSPFEAYIPCGASPSGLDVCKLEPGDILVKASPAAGDDKSTSSFWIRLGGSYFTHSALYLGIKPDSSDNYRFVPTVAEAQGVAGGIDDVWTTSLIKHQFWTGNHITDWAVVRPDATSEQRDAAITYATMKASEVGVEFAMFSDYSVPPLVIIPIKLDDEKKFYCSKLVWRSYKEAGVSVQRPLLAENWCPPVRINTGFYREMISPEDLYCGSPQVQSKDIENGDRVQRFFFYLYNPFGVMAASEQQSPAHFMLIDAQGRRTGYDAVTQTSVAEIPGTVYSGPDAPVETISFAAGNISDGGIRVMIVGDTSGAYTFEAGILSQGGGHVALEKSTTDGQVNVFALTSDIAELASQDSDPPMIHVTDSVQGSNIVIAIQATDNQNGVADVFYSMDGVSYIEYTGPLTVEAGSVEAVYVIASDTIGNRSGAYRHVLDNGEPIGGSSSTLLLPLIRR